VTSDGARWGGNDTRPAAIRNLLAHSDQRDRRAGREGPGDDIIALVGMRRRNRIPEALAAITTRLDADDLAAIDAAVPSGSVAGDRYAPEQLAQLDSEKAAAS
jgi:aryl-alcohol dehydrogenase-like predicted oxidoreductase